MAAVRLKTAAVDLLCMPAGQNYDAARVSPPASDSHRARKAEASDGAGAQTRANQPRQEPQVRVHMCWTRLLFFDVDVAVAAACNCCGSAGSGVSGQREILHPQT